MFESAADDLDRGKIRSNPRQYWVSGRSDPPTGVPPGGVPVTVYSYDLILGNWYCKTGFGRDGYSRIYDLARDGFKYSVNTTLPIRLLVSVNLSV